jgi:hypothetical protein
MVPIENEKTTLPTHPERKTYRLIPLEIPFSSRETLPLMELHKFRRNILSLMPGFN